MLVVVERDDKIGTDEHDNAGLGVKISKRLHVSLLQNRYLVENI